MKTIRIAMVFALTLACAFGQTVFKSARPQTGATERGGAKRGGTAAATQPQQPQNQKPNAVISTDANQINENCRSRVRDKTNVPLWVNDRYNLKAITTVGNHSYAPLCLDGNPDQYHLTILYLIDSFERAHPDLDIEWKVEKQQSAHFTEITYGLWIDHRPRR